VVLGELSAPERRSLHDAVARAMLATGADALATAAQLRAARIRTPAAAEVYLRAGERVRFTDPAAALSWFDDATDASCDQVLVAPGRAEASILLGLPTDIEPGGTGRLAMIAGAAAAHDGRAARGADALLTAPSPGPLLAVPLLAATGRLDQARAASSLPATGQPGRSPGDAGRQPIEVAEHAGHGTPAPFLPDAPQGLRAIAAGGGSLARFATAAIAAAEEPDTAVPLLIEAAEDVERASPTAVLPDTPHALGAIVAVATGDLAAAEHLLERALTHKLGGPAGAERHRLLLAWARMRAGRYDTALAELRREPTELPGRERLLRAAISAGIARRRGDIAGLHAVWDAVEPVLARRAVDLWQLQAVEELLVAAARLKHRRRVEPVIAALEKLVPPAWQSHLGWLRTQVAIADGDAQAVAAQHIPGILGDAARAWATVLGGGTLEPDAVHDLTERLAERQLPWEASRLAGQAAINTPDPAAARRLLERARELSEPDSAAGAATTTLSERELDVARMVLAGTTHREIGAQLYISPKTVEHHVARIRGKLGATSRAELVAMLREIVT
jgi:DNA-binding CsgD family transcriptional regulator